MKKFLQIITVLLLNLNSFSQTPSWLWAKSVEVSSGSTYNRGTSIATDVYGNVFITGTFVSSNITFGAITLTNTSNTYYKDMFIAKYDSIGNILWAKSIGGLLDENPTSITTDINGNVLITGQFNSTSITVGSTNFTNAGGYDIFIIKYNTSGNILWAKKEGGNSDDNSYGIVTDPSGNVIITGNFGSPYFTIGNTTLTNLGNKDIFIAKYNDSGDAVWVKCIGGNSYDISYSIASDVNGNVIVTGNFNSPTMTDGTAILTNNKVNSMFIIKYNSSGNYQWSDSWSGSSINKGLCVTTDFDGNVLLLGNFADTLMTFGGTITLTTKYTSTTLTKYDKFGNALWAKICAESKINGSSIAIDLQGSIFLSGNFICPTVFFGNSTLINKGYGNDVILVKYDASGSEKWGMSGGGSSDDYCSNVAMYQNGDAVILGTFFSNNITFGSNTLTGANSSDMRIFISKINTASNVGIIETQMKNDFLLYPNPFSNQATITFDKEHNNIIIKIIDELGNEVRTINFTGKHLKIERGNLKDGIYFVQIIDEYKNVLLNKILIQ